jgi:hypothetical protein
VCNPQSSLTVTFAFVGARHADTTHRDYRGAASDTFQCVRSYR